MNAKKYPYKKTLNLAMRETPQRKLYLILPVCAALVLVIAAITKFAVIDRLIAVSNAESAAQQAEDQLAEIAEKTKDYDDVRAEYLRITGAMSASEQTLADRISIIDLVDDKLMGTAKVKSFSCTDNVLSVSLGGVDLQGVSGILSALKSSSLVSDVTVYTADNSLDSESGTTVTMTITLNVEGSDGDA